MKLNERLKLARKQKEFTQQEIADILHISRATVSSWEVGRTLPSLDFIIDLSNLYDVFMSVRIDKNALLVDDDRNPDFLFINPNGEAAKFVNKFLEENNKDFKKLYTSVEEQFKLINKIKTP